jgi:hypothetical protein
MRGSRQRPAVHRPLPSAATVTGGRRAGQRRLHGHGFRWQRPEASPRPSGRPNLRHRAQASRPPPVPSRRPSALAPRPCKRVAGATRSARTIRPDGTRPPGMQRAAPRPGARRRRTGRVRWATYARLVGSCLLPKYKILAGCGGSVSLLVRPMFTLLYFTAAKNGRQHFQALG